MSHLHKDHAGAVALDKNLSQLSFPKATYYVQKRELEFAEQKGLPSFIPEELQALKAAQNVNFLDSDKGVIDGYIRYEVTGAHSPFHQVFWIEEDNEIIFFGADDAPQLQQMKHRFVAKYDYDGKKAMEFRKQWWEEGANAGWKFLFYHDIKAPSFSH